MIKHSSYIQLTRIEQDAIRTFKMAANDTVYRISIDDDTKTVRVLCFGIDTLDAGEEGDYVTVNSLPEWIKRKIAVLCMTSLKPPIREVAGIGRRIDEGTFWIFRGTD